MKKTLLYISIILLCSCRTGSENQTAKKIKDIEDKLETMSKQVGYSGTVLIAEREDIVLKRAYGFANLAHQVPNKINTKFGIASMGKMFTAVAIMQLMEQKKLNLQNRIGELLPDYPNVTVRDSVTVEQLLVHTSGLTDFFNEKFEYRAKHTVRTIDDYFNLFKEDDLLFSPGSQFSYSNAGYIVLGMIIENLTGETYYDYVKKNIFDKAGMKNTGNYETDKSIENLAEGYIKKDVDGIWTISTYMKGARGSFCGRSLFYCRRFVKVCTRIKEPQTNIGREPRFDDF